MPTTRAEKNIILKELTENFKNATSVVFAEYKGLTVAELTKLRKIARTNDSEVVVAKKTLIKLAAKNAIKLELPDENLQGAICATFAFKDPIASPKALCEFAKKIDKLKIISGIMEGKLLSTEEVKELASIPSKEILLSKMLGAMQSPISGFVRVLQANIQGLHTVLSAIRDRSASS